MKTTSQFGRWLDKQSRYVQTCLDRAPEFDERHGDDFAPIIGEANRFAAHLGCDVVSEPLSTLEILGKYRAWVRQQTPKEGLTAQEAAEKMGVSLRTIRAMIADGRLPHRKFGRQVRVRAEDCEFKEQPKKSYRHLTRGA